MQSHGGLVSQQTLFADLLAGIDTWDALELARDPLLRIAKQTLTRATSRNANQLDLPGFEVLAPAFTIKGTMVATRFLDLEQYRLVKQRLELRIQSYDYARRSKQALKRDKKMLAEMRRFEPVFARLSASNPQLHLWEAAERYSAEQRSPRIQAKRKGGLAKAAKIKNQRLKQKI